MTQETITTPATDATTDAHFFGYALELKRLIDQHKKEPTWETNAAVTKCLEQHTDRVNRELSEGYDDDEECGNEKPDGAWMQARGHFDFNNAFRVVRVELENVQGPSMDTLNRTGLFFDDPLLEQISNALERVRSGIFEMRRRSESMYRSANRATTTEAEKIVARQDTSDEHQSQLVVSELVISQMDTVLDILAR